MSDKPKPLSTGWVRCQSKSRPDRCYMFNKKTGETNWCTEAVNTTPQRTVSAKEILKTPAQDRLKRLQSNLQKKKINESIPPKAKGIRVYKSLSERLQVEKEKSSAVKAAAVQGKDSKLDISPKKVAVNPTESDPTNECTFATPKKPVSSSIPPAVGPVGPNTNSSATGSKRTGLKRSAQGDLSELDPLPRKMLPNPPNKPEKKPGCSPNKSKKASTPTSHSDSTPHRVDCDVNDNEQPLKEETKSTLLSKAKDVCSNLISKLKPKKAKNPPNTGKERAPNISINSKPSFKPKKPDNKSSLRGVLLENERGSTTPKLPFVPQKVSSPIPVPKESANSRLQRLRNSLHLQQANASDCSSSINVSSDNSFSSSSICSPSLSTSECEPMDWQPIAEDTSVTSPPLSNSQLADSSGFSEHYDTVNENLLRLSADKKQSKQWKTNHFYFVVDTNVFLQNITFVEELTTMKLCETAGTIIYVPYCVLQELDKLKVRSPSESIKTRSARAIKYLNKSFEDKHQRIQAQSAADETKHLIKVTSPDDSILNCCLQVKQNVDNVLLLTEDINLRNKAMCNDVLVSTKSDLVSKHESLI